MTGSSFLRFTICPLIYVLCHFISQNVTPALPRACGQVVYDRDVHTYVVLLFHLCVLYDIWFVSRYSLRVIRRPILCYVLLFVWFPVILRSDLVYE